MYKEWWLLGPGVTAWPALVSRGRGSHGRAVVKNPPANAGDLGSIPALGRSPGEENGNPLQYSSWEIPRTEEPGGLQSMGLEKSQTGLSD